MRVIDDRTVEGASAFVRTSAVARVLSFSERVCADATLAAVDPPTEDGFFLDPLAQDTQLRGTAHQASPRAWGGSALR